MQNAGWGAELFGSLELDVHSIWVITGAELLFFVHTDIHVRYTPVSFFWEN